MAWFGMRASVFHAIDDELRDRVRGVTQFMENQISSLSILEIRDEFREHSVLGPGGDLFQVCDEQGQWLYRSVPLENANVGIALPASLPEPSIPGPPRRAALVTLLFATNRSQRKRHIRFRWRR